MNTYKPNSPRYFRLLEKKETRQEGDIIEYPTGELTDELTFGTPVGNNIVFRPVTVDLWISYAEQKPTKEDFEPTGKIEMWCSCSDREVSVVGWEKVVKTYYNSDTYSWLWRRIRPPTPAKPKSVTVTVTLHRKHGRTPIVEITPNSDGTARLDCGDIISAESVEEFIQAREGVMNQ